MIKDEILKNLKIAVSKLSREKIEIDLQLPTNADFGDYSTNIALKLKKILMKNPIEIAEEIKKNFPKTDFIEKIDIVKPGFINFWISKFQLINRLKDFSKNEFDIPQIKKDKKIIIEYTDPNILKEFHIGHLYSNVVGESLAKIFESLGANVRRANYQGDVGMHIAKAIWGIKQKIKKEKITLNDIGKKSFSEKARFMGESYTLGVQEFEKDKSAKKEMIELNKKIYDQSDPKINELYLQAKNWSLDYFEYIYQRLGTNFDDYYFESDAGKVGLDLVKKYLKKRVFEKSKGAIVFNGEKYGLHTRVFINSLGLPTYEAKDLGLAITKYKKFPYDLSIIVVGTEVKEYFKVVLKALEQINPKLRKNTINIFTGMVNLLDGKMSSRLGNVVTFESLIDELSKKAWYKIQETTKQHIENQSVYYSKNTKVVPSQQLPTSEKIGMAAIKYFLLKNSLGTNFRFDINQSIKLDGNSGPYLLYTYVRCQSVLKKEQYNNITIKKYNNFGKDELNLIRKLYQFPEIILKTAENYSPNLITNYLYELASEFNLFYQKNPILKAKIEVKKLRLLITKATANTIKKGLDLLGIKTVEQM